MSVRTAWIRAALLASLAWLASGCAVPLKPGTGADFSALVEEASPALVTVLGPAGALGSGFVVAESGLVATTAHGLGRHGSLVVILADGRQVAARVLRRSDTHDLALLAPERPLGLRGLALAGAMPRVGSPVLALGNPFGLGPAASAGIVGAVPGALGREGPLADLVQTDAAINPGNSGGPLLDLRGEVVGVVSASASLGHGIGFAVPVARLRELLEAGAASDGQ